MDTIGNIVAYAILNSIMFACVKDMDEQNNIVNKENSLASVAISIYDTDNEIVKLWRQANKEQLRLVKEL